MLERPVGRIEDFSGVLLPGLEAEDDVGGLALVLEKTWKIRTRFYRASGSFGLALA